MKRALAFALAASLVQTSAAFAMEQGKFAPERGIVFPSDRIKDFLRPCSREAPKDVIAAWQPSGSQIAELELRMLNPFQKARQEEIATYAQTAPDPSEYYRQYIGLFQAGRKTIYVNAFLWSPPAGNILPAHRDFFDWHRWVQNICDGGVGGFGAEYDLDSKTFRNFEFNGCMCNPVSMSGKPQ